MSLTLKGSLKPKFKFFSFQYENVSLKVMNTLVCSKTMTKFAFRRYNHSKLSLSLLLKWIMDFYDITTDFKISSPLLSNQMLSRI